RGEVSAKRTECPVPDDPFDTRRELPGKRERPGVPPGGQPHEARHAARSGTPAGVQHGRPRDPTATKARSRVDTHNDLIAGTRPEHPPKVRQVDPSRAVPTHPPT